MLRLSYVKFMQDLQQELKNQVGLPFQINIDIKIAIPENKDSQEKLNNFVKTTLQPIINSVPTKVMMQ